MTNPLIQKIKSHNWRYEYRFWINFACVALMLLWFLIAIATTKYSLPIWAWHTATGHHLYDILFSFCIPFFYLWSRKGLRPLYSFIIIGFLVGTNEIAWWITYFISHYILLNTNYYLPVGIVNKYTFDSALLNLTLYNFELYAYIVVIVLFFYFFKVRKLWILSYFMILFFIYLYWIQQGFPITIDFSGITILYLSLKVNLIEIFHWIIPTTFLVVFYDWIFEQNSKLKGLPPIIVKKYFFPGLPTQDLIDLEKSLAITQAEVDSTEKLT